MNHQGISSAKDKNRIRLLWFLGAVSLGCYVALSLLSEQFQLTVEEAERPTLLMLGLLAIAYLCNWLAIPLSIKLPEKKPLVLGIFLSSALFRLVLLPSTPMHEIDIYRYVWDGAVVAEGISPYQYSPKTIREAAAQGESVDDSTLQKLIELRNQSPALAESLDQIHYAYLPSPYPPVSQAVFAIADLITPASAQTYTRLIVMKAILVLFDLATLMALMALLKLVGKPIGWALVYGWCPLVMKEIANSGHLDSIAIFLTTLAVYLLVRGIPETKSTTVGTITTSLALALAIAAKLYPVVLVPLFAVCWWRRVRLKTAMTGLGTVGVLTALFLLPMFRGGSQPIDESETSTAPTSGISAFLKQWEMNDLIFMVVLENLRSQSEAETHKKPWFIVVPDSWAKRIESLNLASSPKQTTFLLARLVTVCLFLGIALWLAWRASQLDTPEVWCRAVMLTLAWFWFTSPTQNPWYWCWVLPFLPFAQFRAWHLVGALSLLYYLRFWLGAHFPEPPVLGTAYDGKHFYYYVIPWLEFCPCLALLAAEHFLQKSSIS